jgi:hypothetical protein
MKYIGLLAGLAILVACSESDQNKGDVNTEDDTINEISVDYRSLGDSLTMNAQSTLLGFVSSQIGSNGFEGAVSYCNVHAVGITDSLSNLHGAKISRVTDKTRNKNNSATDEERAILDFFRSNPNTKDTLVEADGQKTYYKKIGIGMPTCLKCHGNEEKDIDKKALSVINEKYPDDEARNYKMGDLRGAWKVVFEN